MYGNNNNNYNNYNTNYNAARATPSKPDLSEYGNASWQGSGGYNTQPIQQNWGASPSSPKVTPPMMNGMGMGMPPMDMGMGMGMGMNNNMGMAPPRKFTTPYSNNNNYGSDNLDVNSAKNLNVNVNVNYAPKNWDQNNNMGMGYNNNGGYNPDLDMKMMANRNASPTMSGMGMGMNNMGMGMVPMTSLAYRTAAYSQPMVPDARGDTQFDGVAPETFNGMQNAFGGAGMYKSNNYEEHNSANAQYLRDAVLGVNDGLVSMLLLTLGLSGGGLNNTQVLLAGITGAVGGAISMALGEYIATKSQGQVTTAEIKLEKVHLMNHREKELQEVRTFMQELNLEGELLEKCVAAINQRDEAMIRLMMAFEFGFQEELERSPIKAMLTSGSLFLSGSLPSVLPYAVTTNANTALGISIALCSVALFGIGAGKTKVTKGPWLYDGMENLILGAIGGAATFGLGKAYNTGKTTTAA